MNAPLVPASFEVPVGLETDRYQLRMLTVHDVIKDYEAVMSSVAHLKGVLDPGSSWPEGLSLEQNLIDLGWHQKEFQRRSSFAYTVVRPDEKQCLGCIYIYPSTDADVDVFLWVRADEFESLDEHLNQTIRNWMTTNWPFKKVSYPGRE
jgi:hypothetical protein